MNATEAGYLRRMVEDDPRSDLILARFGVDRGRLLVELRDLEYGITAPAIAVVLDVEEEEDA